MSIKITVQEALDASISCNELIKKSFPAKLGFKIIRLKKELELIEQSFNETKNSTIIKYAEKDENGQPKREIQEDGKTFLSIALENREKCTKELTEALNEEVEVSQITFNSEEFGNEDILTEILIGLFPFIIE